MFGDGFGASDKGCIEEAAGFSGLVGDRGGFPDAEGEDPRLGRAEFIELRRDAEVPEGMGRKASEVADGDAVPEDLVGVIDVGDEDGELWLGSGAGGDVDVAAVPGEAGVGEMSLDAPGFVGGDGLPVRVVEGGGGPGRVVAKMELPWSGKGDGGLSEALDGEGWRRRGGARGGDGGESGEQKQRQPDETEARGHDSWMIPLNWLPETMTQKTQTHASWGVHR